MAAALPRTKQQDEEKILKELRWACYLSKHTDLLSDPRVAAAANDVLLQIYHALPSGWFSGEYIQQMGLLDFEGNFAFQINHDMTEVTLVRTSPLSNVHQFQRGGA